MPDSQIIERNVDQIIDKTPVTIEGLEHESEEIERKFAKVAASIYRSLNSRNISKDSLVACLMGFGSLTKVFDGTNPSRFHNQRARFNEPSATVATVWTIVGEYFSFFDYEVLEIITNTLGTDQDNQKISDYKNDFEAYARRRLFISPEKTASPNSRNCKSSMIVLLDSSYDDCEIGRLKRLETKLSEIFNLNRGVLQLRKVRKGSLLIVFEIPDFIVDLIFSLSPDQESVLYELGVLQLDCGEYHFNAKVCLCYLFMLYLPHHAYNFREILLKVLAMKFYTQTILVRVHFSNYTVILWPSSSCSE